MKKTIGKKGLKMLSVAEFDAMAERGEDLFDYFDHSKAIFRVNVDFPKWMADALVREAERLNISRQAVIKTWIKDRLMAERRHPQARRGKKVVSPELVVAHTDRVRRFVSSGKKFEPRYKVI